MVQESCSGKVFSPSRTPRVVLKSKSKYGILNLANNLQFFVSKRRGETFKPMNPKLGDQCLFWPILIINILKISQKCPWKRLKDPEFKFIMATLWMFSGLFFSNFRFKIYVLLVISLFSWFIVCCSFLGILGGPCIDKKENWYKLK